MNVYLKSCGVGVVNWAHVNEEDVQRSMSMMKDVVMKELQQPATTSATSATSANSANSATSATSATSAGSAGNASSSTTRNSLTMATEVEGAEFVEAKEEEGFAEMVEQSFLRWLME